jgi:hypothetical protein
MEQLERTDSRLMAEKNQINNRKEENNNKYYNKI